MLIVARTEDTKDWVGGDWTVEVSLPAHGARRRFTGANALYDAARYIVRDLAKLAYDGVDVVARCGDVRVECGVAGPHVVPEMWRSAKRLAEAMGDDVWSAVPTERRHSKVKCGGQGTW